MVEEKLERALQKYYGFSSFRPGQKEIILDVLDGKDVLGILPTGSGKSLCYQLPARILKGSVLVISPLISLMTDQEKQLIAKGFKRVISINSFLSFEKKKTAFQQLGSYDLIYASPEMLQSPEFVAKLKQIQLALFVVDEAHCISQWGHEFRPDYLKLGDIVGELGRPPILALSATATPEVQEDIIYQLKSDRMKKHIHPMDRENIALKVDKFPSPADKLTYLSKILEKYKVPTMIYFSSRNWTEKAAITLSNAVPDLKIAYYHGGMEQTDRILVQQQFMNDELDVICCTSAFGMGIDKNNIRLVVHFHLPTQIESFIQEIGRAGRDGKSSVSLVMLAPNDDLLPKKLIQLELPVEMEVERVFHRLQAIQQKEGKLFEKDEENAQFMDISETQWRFLRYHLEKQAVIGQGRIAPEFEDWNQVKLELGKIVNWRTSYKESKLSELLKWAESESICRREGLFSAFQDSVKPPTYGCCDHCGFTLGTWQPEEQTRRNETIDWKEDFKMLMLQGDRNEVH
ncbi:RecQ family ATP-dependent DNA helicase [Sediminibacillus massiliensis]|uniref:RecQ family ATP-dependent DNA helicase n=1 Tax=Sediminibacillus massiliensis TaxID=1926277 RepID=UPI0009883C51|nr:ATP-dependent DNA helicase RecQ [Sediminibacillus massiliensis]